MLASFDLKRELNVRHNSLTDRSDPPQTCKAQNSAELSERKVSGFLSVRYRGEDEGDFNFLHNRWPSGLCCKLMRVATSCEMNCHYFKSRLQCVSRQEFFNPIKLNPNLTSSSDRFSDMKYLRPPWSCITRSFTGTSSPLYLSSGVSKRSGVCLVFYWTAGELWKRQTTYPSSQQGEYFARRASSSHHRQLFWLGRSSRYRRNLPF